MMFRRFLQRLKQHQWGAIATELAIVIIGVFIGMQVSDWKEGRVDSTANSCALMPVFLQAPGPQSMQRSGGCGPMPRFSNRIRSAVRRPSSTTGW